MPHDEERGLALNQPEHYHVLGSDTQSRLRQWIAAHIASATEIAQHTSYTLKHEFERSPAGVFVTNGQFKGAMRAAGYEPIDATALNWRYRIHYRR